MAAAVFNRLVNPAQGRALSAGTHPADRVHAVVVDAMREIGIDLSTARVVYQWGGQGIAYRSESCRGSLTLAHGEATIDITCNQPTIGTGERSFDDTVELVAR